MRVTHQLIKNNVMRNIHNNLGRMSKLQNMLSSGKQLSKPSDDPVRVARVMSHNTTLARSDQYKRNIHSANSWMNVTEGALQHIGDVLQRARELAIKGATGTNSEGSRRAIAMEIDELTNVLVQLGNTSYEGRYIFAGYQTNDEPFSRDKSLLESGEPTSVTYTGDDGILTWEVAPQVTIRGNITGNELFLDLDIFATMDNLEKALLDGDDAAMQEAIGKLSAAVDHILDKRASIGAITNGLETVMEKYLSDDIAFKELRSQLEDIDFAEMYMNFAVMESIYRASLSAGARIIQPSLLDFLR